MGRKLKLPDSWSFLWQFHDIFFREIYWFNPRNEAPIIIDCGANIGLSCLFFKQRYPNSNVIAYEPDDTIFSFLNENIGDLDGIDLQKKAVWIHPDGVNFTTTKADTGHVSSTGSAKVESIRLRDVLDRFDSIDLLKIDIEGAEFEVLEDCSEALHKVQSLFIEVHTFADRDQKISRLLQILEHAGFRYFIENENEQQHPLRKNWKVSETGMDVQLNIFAVQES